MYSIKDHLDLLIRKMENSHFPNFNYDYWDFYEFITQTEYASSMIKTIYANIDYDKLQQDTEGRKTLEMISKYRKNQLQMKSK